MFVHVFVRLSASPLTFSNRLCQWLVIYNNKRQLTIEIGFLHSESQPIMSFLSSNHKAWSFLSLYLRAAINCIRLWCEVSALPP